MKMPFEGDVFHHEIEPRAIPVVEVARDLGSELKLLFQGEAGRFLKEHPEMKKLEKMDELSVEVYEKTADIRSRIEDLQGERAAKDLPKEDVALLVMRFPEAFKYEIQNEFSPKAAFKQLMTSLFWGVRDEFETRYGVDIERVNPIADHEDTPMSGYYYIWLITPIGQMPKHLIYSDEDLYEDEDEEDDA